MGQQRCSKEQVRLTESEVPWLENGSATPPQDQEHSDERDAHQSAAPPPRVRLSGFIISMSCPAWPWPASTALCHEPQLCDMAAMHRARFQAQWIEKR